MFLEKGFANMKTRRKKNFFEKVLKKYFRKLVYTLKFNNKIPDMQIYYKYEIN